MSNFSRRDFLKITNRFLAVSGLAIILGPIIAFFYPKKLEKVPSEPISAGPENELSPGTSKTIRFGRYPALVINTEDGLRAYSAVCTHFACLVKYDPEQNTILCPCHDGFFDPLNGEVISGPPPSPLESFNVEIREGQIFVGGSE
jgi:nitrite reductase/ring-hydroxylating ferredoxin subunit